MTSKLGAAESDFRGDDDNVLRGTTWDNDRGYKPLVSAGQPDEVDIALQWTKRPLQAFADEPLDELARRFDVLVIDHPFVGIAARSGCLLPLDELLSGETLNDIAATAVGPSFESYIYAGHLWALPIDVACQVSAYRLDLLGKSGHSVPRSWRQVTDLAKDLAHKNARLMLPSIPVDAILTYFTLAANAGVPAGQLGGDLVPRSVGESALSLMRDLIGFAHPASCDLNPIDALELMSSTDEVAYVPLLFGYSNYSRTGYRRHRILFANIPSANSGPNGSTLGGAGYAVSAFTNHAKDAARHGEWLMSEGVQCGAYFRGGGQPGHRAAWVDPALDAIVGNFFLATSASHELAYLRPRFDGYIEFQSAAGDVVTDFLRRPTSVGSVYEEIERLYREHHAIGASVASHNLTIGD
jgi:multiple sugar transport system substrate-binding protein